MFVFHNRKRDIITFDLNLHRERKIERESYSPIAKTQKNLQVLMNNEQNQSLEIRIPAVKWHVDNLLRYIILTRHATLKWRNF